MELTKEDLQSFVLDNAVTSDVVKKAMSQSVEMRHTLKSALEELDTELKSVHHWKAKHFDMSYEEHLQQVEYDKVNKLNKNKKDSDSISVPASASIADSYVVSPKKNILATSSSSSTRNIPSGISFAASGAHNQNPSYNKLYSNLEHNESDEVVTDNLTMFARHRTPRGGKKGNTMNGATSNLHSPYLDTKINLLSKINSYQ